MIYQYIVFLHICSHNLHCALDGVEYNRIILRGNKGTTKLECK